MEKAFASHESGKGFDSQYIKKPQICTIQRKKNFKIQ
jgi:hypothetical protein